MKIKNVKINHFGNLENKEITLENKFNIIYGKNESGKSTLLNYIKCIFYGISKKKNGKEISDYDRYNPWMKEDFSGRLQYELDNGKTFEIFREFKSKNPKIYNECLEEISKQFNIQKDGIPFFYEQTGIDEEMFLSTIVSMQQEVKLNKESQNILLQKIANLAGTGDDNISFQKILDKLNKKQVEEIGTERTQEKPINIVKKRMQEISEKIKEMKLAQVNKEEIQEKKEKIIEKINELELKNSIYTKINELNIEKNIEDEKINLKNKIKIETKEKLENLEKEKEKLINNKNSIKLNDLENKNLKEKDTIPQKRNKEKKYVIGIISSVILAIILKILNEFCIQNTLIDYIAYGLPIITILMLIICYMFSKAQENKKIKEYKLKKELEEQKLALEVEKNKNEQVRIEQQIENIDNQIKNYQEEIQKQEEDIKFLQNNIDKKIDSAIEQIRQENLQKEIDYLLDSIDFKNIKNDLYFAQQELNNSKLSLNTIENEEKNILLELDSMISLEEEYKNLEEELKELEEQTNNISLTKKYLENAYIKMKNTVTPKFTENLSQNISEISNKKYTKVTINDEKGIVVENQYGDYISANQLSIGTIDQLYLSLRLSMIDDLSSENMPIILDEAFAYYDDERLENILNFLIKRSGKNQIILFTCTKREQEILSKIRFSLQFS